MARRSTSSTTPQPPILTVEQMRRRIERLENCIRDLEAFDPQTVQKRYGVPEVEALEAAIDDALAAAFGHRTHSYNRYKDAADLDNGPHVVRVQPAFGRGPMIDYDAQEAHEARRYFADGKQRSIALVRQAIRALEADIADKEQSVPARPAAAAQPNSQSMTDGELRHKLLSHFYRLRHSNGGYVQVDDMIIPGTGFGLVTLEAIGNVCRQLGERGLIEWTAYLVDGPPIGSARITGIGVDEVERGSLNNEIRFSPANASAPNLPPANDALLSEDALTDIREFVNTVKTELPTLTLSNSAKSEITSDIGQIEIETGRPTPRKSFLRMSLESMRDSLAKTVGGAAAGFVAAATAILAKHFGLY
jgi:hypothetical protein